MFRRRAPEAPSPFQLREPTPWTAFAGVASGSAGLPSIYWNPATITRFEGRNLSAGATLVFPYADITPQPGTDPSRTRRHTGDIAEDAVMPTFNLGWQLNDRVWLGLSANAPFGLSTHAPDTTASQLYGRKSEAFSFSLSPSVGYKVNDWLSVGAAVQLLYFDAKLTRRTAPSRFARQRDHLRRLRCRLFARRHDHAGKGHHDRHRVSVADRDRPGGRLHPDLDFAGLRYDVEATLTLPEMLTVSLEQVVSESTKVFATYEFTGWDTFDLFPVSTDFPLGLPPLAYWYDDSHYFSVGGEHAVNDKLNLVGGVGYQISPVSDEVRVSGSRTATCSGSAWAVATKGRSGCRSTSPMPTCSRSRRASRSPAPTIRRGVPKSIPVRRRRRRPVRHGFDRLELPLELTHRPIARD